MVIAHNMESIFGNNQLKKTEKSKGKAMERLGSGYRINRASDDAAGLTISEKMRWQVRGLSRASENAKDAISMVQVADGALGEMEDILHRMTELAVQGANDTNTAQDRDAIQQEINAMSSQINTISKNTTFNTMTLLYHPNDIVKIDADNYENISLNEQYNIAGKTVYGKAMDFGTVNASNIEKLMDKAFYIDCTQGCSQKFKFAFTNEATSSVTVTPPGGSRPDTTVNIGIGAGSSIKNGTDIVIKIKELLDDSTTQSDIMSGSGTTPEAGITYIGHANGLDVDGSKLIMYGTGGSPSTYGKLHAGELSAGDEFYNFQLGAGSEQGMKATFKTITTSTLGIDGLSVSSFEAAGKSITAIEEAVDKVNDFRAYLGATQNRLEHAYSVDDNTAENTQAAESQLRDANMSDEMVELSRANILAQAGQSMLAQANQSKQGILTVLG